MSCKTRSPEDNITSTSCRCSASRCVVANTSATLTTPDNGDRISCDIVANICFALIVSSAHEHIFFCLRDITSELNSGSFRVWVSSPSGLYDSGASGISISWSGHLFEDNTISRHLAPHLISRQPKRKPYSQARNLLQKGLLNYIPQIRERLDARKKRTMSTKMHTCDMNGPIEFCFHGFLYCHFFSQAHQPFSLNHLFGDIHRDVI
jgi:hypothetical protein